MKVHAIFLGLAVSTAAGIAIQYPAFAEEYRGTFEQQMACTPDVWRLCFNQIPDVNRITACLRQNTSQLSGACRSVFESNASVPAPPPSPAPAPAPKRRSDQ
jgi:hypothetical protein